MALTRAGTQEATVNGLTNFVTLFNAAATEIDRVAAAGVGGALANTKIIVGNAGGAAAAVNVSGDATIANTGALTIGAGKITVAKMHADASAGLSRVAVLDEETQSVTLRGDCTIQVNDAAGVAIAEAALVRVWFGATDLAAPDATDNTVAIETGTSIQAVTANAHYLILTDATGAAEVRVTVAGAGDRYVMVEQGGRVVSQKLEIAVIE